MLLFYVLGAVVVAAIGVVGFLFYLLNQESGKEIKVVPVDDLNEKIQQVSSREKEYEQRVEELQRELRSIAEKGAAQSQDAMGLVEQLTKENEDLKIQIFKRDQQQVEKLAAIEQETIQLRQDNQNLHTQLEASQAKVQALQEEAVVVRQQMEEDLKRANDAVEEFKKNQVDQSSKQNAQLEDLKSENEGLRQQIEDLQRTGQKLKELNDSLISKNELLQYELVKHRAQASGLERICENYKLQLSKRV